MTLILTTGRSGNFVAMSGDKRRVTHSYLYDLKTGEYEKIDDKPIIDEVPVNNKVVKLSNYALMGLGGTASLGEYLRDTMLKLVEEDDDLGECAKKLKKIITGARNELRQEIFFPFLNQENGVMVTISGFYSDNSTGVVSFVSGTDTLVNENKVPKGSSYWTLIPPIKKYLEMGSVLININELDPRLFEMNIEKPPNRNEVWKTIHAEQMIWFHSLVAENQPTEVSKDGFLHSLVLDSDGIIQYSVEEFVT